MKRNINMPEADYHKLRRARKTLEKLSPLIKETKKHAEEMKKHLNQAHNIVALLDNKNSTTKEKEI